MTEPRPVWTGDHWEVSGAPLAYGERVVLDSGKAVVVDTTRRFDPQAAQAARLHEALSPWPHVRLRLFRSRTERLGLGLGAAFCAIYGPLSTWPQVIPHIVAGLGPFTTTVLGLGGIALANRQARLARESNAVSDAFDVALSTAVSDAAEADRAAWDARWDAQTRRAARLTACLHPEDPSICSCGGWCPDDD